MKRKTVNTPGSGMPPCAKRIVRVPSNRSWDHQFTQLRERLHSMPRWPDKTLSQRFWEKVNVGLPDLCWEWMAMCMPQGYGRFTVNAETRTPAHRIAYQLSIGPIPEGYDVCHHCDNPPCCNPAHLFSGTRHENMIDAFKKGRIAKGFKLPQTKLSDEQVDEILIRVASGECHHVVGGEFGISRGHVSALKRGLFRSKFGSTRKPHVQHMQKVGV